LVPKDLKVRKAQSVTQALKVHREHRALRGIQALLVLKARKETQGHRGHKEYKDRKVIPALASSFRWALCTLKRQALTPEQLLVMGHGRSERKERS